MSKRTRSLSSAGVMFCLIMLSTLWGYVALTPAMASTQSSDVISKHPSSHSISTSAEIDTTWRHTKHGWQDSSRWPVETYVPRKTIQLLHPFTWAAIVLITVMATTIWASSEWEISRLFGDNVKKQADRSITSDYQ